MSPGLLRPKRPRWFLAAAVCCAASVAAWGAAAWMTPWMPGRVGGLIAGTAAAAVFALDGVYAMRRRLMAWPLGTAQHWLQLHVYGGVVATVWVWIHVGFRWPAGQFGWWLLVLTMAATITGLAGVWLQKWAPAAMATGLTVEAIYERIPDIASRLPGEAERVVAGASDVLQRFHATEVRPLLAEVRFSWARVADVRSDLDRRLAPFRTVSPFLDPAERGRLADLEAIVVEQTQLEANYALQWLLRSWLVVHVPVSLALLGVIAVHVAAVLVF